jgi:hypothetical protein
VTRASQPGGIEPALRYTDYLLTATTSSVRPKHIGMMPDVLRETPARGADLLVRMWPNDSPFHLFAAVETMMYPAGN